MGEWSFESEDVVWRVLVKGYYLVCRSCFMIERVINESDGILIGEVCDNMIVIYFCFKY